MKDKHEHAEECDSAESPMIEQEVVEEQKLQDFCETDENMKTNSRFRNFFLFLFTLLISIIIGYIQISLFDESSTKSAKSIFRDTSIPLPEDSHTWFISKNFFNETVLKELEKLAKSSVYSTIKGGDSSAASTLPADMADSAGEAVEVGHNDCDHPFMSVNLNRTMCHIPQRIDVGNHFIATGGFNSAMESYEKMVSRILVFHSRFNSLIKNNRISEEITKNEEFLNHAKEICKNDAKSYDDSLVTDLYHFDLVLLIAGQGI